MTHTQNLAINDQDRPSGSGPDVVSLVHKDLEARAEKGRKTYGERLKPRNGRDALQDAYQEALDLCLYLRQHIEEQRFYKDRQLGVDPEHLEHLEHLKSLRDTIIRISRDLSWIESNFTNLTGKMDKFGDEIEDELTELWPFFDLTLAEGSDRAIEVITNYLTTHELLIEDMDL